jgi:hypothetical protein
MTIDGGLRKLFRDNLMEAQWTSIETGGTGLGVPDAEYCFYPNRQGWIEFKKTAAIAVKIDPEQVSWLERRVRMGGKCWLIVRKQAPAGLRRARVDAIYIYRGAQARAVLLNGLQTPPIDVYEGGPAKWNWALIAERLKN